MTKAEIYSKFKSSRSFRLKLQELVAAKKLLLSQAKNLAECEENPELAQSWNQTDDTAKIIKNPKLAQSRNQTYQKNKLSKSAETARLARSSLKKIKGGLISICNTVNISSFTKTFFNEKHLQDYERLNPLMKLLVAQYVLYSEQDSNLKSYPFCFLLPTELHGVNVSILSKKIQRKLSLSLKGNVVDMWFTGEYFGNGYRKPDKRITHIHGEMSIDPTNLPAIKRVFVQIFRQASKNDIKRVPACNIIKFPQSRNLNSHLYGKLYGVFNHPSYSFKQDVERSLDAHRTWFDCRLQGKPYSAPNKEKFLYISADLNKKAKELYNNHIK
jgi:hypothetical protein